MKKRLFLTLFLIFLAALGVWSFLIKGQYFIGQNYFDSHDIANEQEYFLQGLKEYVLDPVDFEKAESAIQVNDDEIMYYREYYGSLEKQLANIQAQYESAVTGEETVAETETTQEEKTDIAPATSEAQRLQQERDQKLAEVRRNFDSDEVVKEKILAIKKQALAKYKAEYEKGRVSLKSNIAILRID